MGKRLTDEQVAAFRDRGFTFPVRIMPRDQADRGARSLARAEARHADLTKRQRNNGLFRVKPHLLFTWLSGNVPKFYDRLVQAAATRQGRARVENWQQYQALNAQEWALLTERYDLLADMP